ncbi:MAG TPA: GTP 3',8-cyclase MoaA [Geobacteraceae bacterium]
MELLDKYGRHIRYLRLSVTDRCNLRCQYCMPAEGVPKRDHGEVLSYEELYRVASEAVAMGIDKIRLTGGEPLVRRGLLPFVEQLARLPGLKELVLTTNGMLLGELARPLRLAGIKRLNVSLDSLRPDRFAAITRGGELTRVLDGMEAALAAGFPHPKINMVVMRGINDDEVPDFAALTLTRACTVRFIEYMPNLQEPGWQERCVPGAELLERLGQQYRLSQLVSSETAGPAKNFRIAGAAGTIGFITPISGHFCGSCNRIRVSATGMAHGCLFAGTSIDLKPALASGNCRELRRTLHALVVDKPQGHILQKEQSDRSAFAMSGIGG